MERSLGIMGYLSSPPYLAKGEALLPFSPAMHASFQRVHPNFTISPTSIYLHQSSYTSTDPQLSLFTFILLYLPSYTFTNRHPPSDAHIDYVRLLFLKSSAQGTEFMLCRNLTSRRLDKESAVQTRHLPSLTLWHLHHLPLQTSYTFNPLAGSTPLLSSNVCTSSVTFKVASIFEGRFTHEIIVFVYIRFISVFSTDTSQNMI